MTNPRRGTFHVEMEKEMQHTVFFVHVTFWRKGLGPLVTEVVYQHLYGSPGRVSSIRELVWSWAVPTADQPNTKLRKK